MNVFDKHGIQHLSPSSLACWRESPGVWSLKYLAGVKDEGGAAAWRGSAVENGLAAMLRGGATLADATAVALQAYEQNAQGEIADDINAEREMIAPMLAELSKWQPPSNLNAAQIRVEHFMPDIPVPVIGYVDFAFDGIDIDLKTTKACPSTPRPNHVRQVSFYRAARNRKGALLYVTGKKRAYFEIDDAAAERAMNELRADALSLMGFLARVDSPLDAVHILPMNLDDFRFSDKAKTALEELLA